jgi:predicted RNase H-like nuclease (RuvC/YqgF family)
MLGDVVMSWWEMLLLGGGGAGGVWAVVRKALSSRKLRSVVADVLDGPDNKGAPVEELRVILEEQRKGYDHLVARVERLENDVATLNRKLAEARLRERNLEQQLKDERQASAERIAELHAELGEARARIAELEAMLARYHPDGLTPR